MWFEWEAFQAQAIRIASLATPAMLVVIVYVVQKKSASEKSGSL
jgi:hypothetical protein